MKKDFLTILGCSGSLAVSLLSGTSAHANQLNSYSREYVFTPSNSNQGKTLEVILPPEMANDSESFDCECSAIDDMADFTDEEGDKAIARFGCDCAGCRYMVRYGMDKGDFNG